ncbi:MAG: BTAD domain-containing putative transcriptional regulator [Acidimicrobiales bacterium]|nr:BTAD domain-containing putative transcriptional regulator [Acidimicrobiales bacterium]
MIVTQRPGYLLSVPEGAHDLLRVRRLLERARALIPSDPAGAVAELDAALACWRGEPLSDIAGDDLARNLAAGLASLRDTAFDDRAEVALGLERHAEELAALTAGVSVDPFNERRRGLLMMALYRCGRQAEALEVYQEGRRVLVDELGISPSPALRALEADILDHAPGLALAAPPRLVAERPTVRTGGIVVPSAWLEAGGELLALVEAVTTIGRSADRHVVIEGDKVSRSHAEIRVAGGEHVLVDQGSTNGTTVNGERIVRARLADGDEIGIGPARLRFVSRG